LDGKQTTMMDGRFDHHFAELFAAAPADEGGKGGRPPLLPLAMARLSSLVPAIAATLLRGIRARVGVVGLNPLRLRAKRLRGCRHLPRRSPPDAPR
jgi:hypothetical protein